MDIAAAYRLLKEEMGAHGLIDLGWEAKLDDATTRFGVCRMGKLEISISRPLVHLNPEDEVRDTILHEIAHALAWEHYRENCGHDERWKKICRRIGARPERCYDDEVIQPDLPWALCHRDTGEIFSTRARKPEGDASNRWIRGRKEETLGKLVYRLNPKLYPDGPLGKFDPLIVREFREEVLEAIGEVAKRRGISTEAMKGKFTDEEFDLTLRFSLGPVDYRAAEERNFETHAPMFGLTAEDYRRPFRVGLDKYILVEIKPRNRKYPLIGVNGKGKRYKFPLSVLGL